MGQKDEQGNKEGKKMKNKKNGEVELLGPPG